MNNETLESNVLITLLTKGDIHQYVYWNEMTNILVVEERVNLKIKGLDRVKDSDRDDYRAEIKAWKDAGYTVASTSETDLF